MKQIFQVGGMRCASCQAHVAKAVKALPGVEHADVNLITGRMTVEHSGGNDFAQTVIQAVKSAGFTAELVEDATPAVATVKSIFQVGGMRCASCQAHVAKAVKALPGVEHADVNLVTGRMTVEHKSGPDMAKSIDRKSVV